MIIQDKSLSSGRWGQMPLCEQMANIGSEVNRALNWRKKGNSEYSQKAVNRALELLSLSINHTKINSHYKELTRLKEALVDYFYGVNLFSSSEILWRKYFNCFLYASRKNY